jgi:tRNA threonylcarbamoyladenosine modification (KEOPS) complex Cgi121 subunit
LTASRVVVESRLLGGQLDPEEVRTRVRASNPKAMVQSFRPQKTSNSRYYELVALQTLVSQAEDCMLAKKPEIDFLLRVAGTAQIKEAILKIGARRGEPFVLVAAVERGRVRGLEGLGRALPRRKLTENELDGVERAAMLNAERA